MIFDRNPTTGALTARGGSQYPSCLVELSGYGGGYGTSGCAQESHLNGVRDLAVSPDGQNLYAAAGDADAIVVFAITEDGYLYSLSSASPTANACITSGSFTAGYPCTLSNTTTLDGANSVLVSDDGNTVYVTGGDSDGGVSVFERESDGSLNIPSGRNDCHVRGGSGIYCQNVHSVSRAQDLATDGEHVYVASKAGLNTITVFDRDTSTGYLTPHSGSNECVSQDSDGPSGSSLADDSACESTAVGSIDGVSGLALSPDGQFLHAVSSVSNSLSTFTVDSSGNLEQLPADAGACLSSSSLSGCGTATGGMSDPEKVAVSPDGYTAYAASADADAVAQFTLDPDTGAAAQAAAPTGCAEDLGASSGSCDSARVLYYANNVTVSTDGNFVYVSAFGEGDTNLVAGQGTEGSVSIFSRAVSVSSEEEPEEPEEPEETEEPGLPALASGTDTVSENAVPGESSTTSTSTAGEASSTCAALVGAKRKWAVTKWKGLAGMSTRLETKAGAFLRTDSEKKAQFLTKARSIEGGKVSVRRVDYYIDDTKVSAATSNPWRLLVDPTTLSVGEHMVKAVVYSSATSRTATLKLSITVSPGCENARYVLGMLSKIRRAFTNVRFWLRSGDADMTNFTVALPSAIQIRKQALKKYRGRVFGGVQTIAKDGTKIYTSFKVPKLDESGQATLLSRSDGLKAVLKTSGGGVVSVSGLSAGINDVRIWLRGHKIKALQNVNRCSKLNSKADLRNSVSSLTLTTNAALCTNKR